jgi:hypothetical protein
MILPDLGMHRAGVDRSGRRLRYVLFGWLARRGGGRMLVVVFMPVGVVLVVTVAVVVLRGIHKIAP